MIRFLLVRHADSLAVGNDAPLSAVGREKAKALAQRLADWQLDMAWSSDLRRAEETAIAILRGRGTPQLHRTPLLREVEIPPKVAAAGPGCMQYEQWEREVVDSLAQRLTEWLRLLLSSAPTVTRHSKTAGATGEGGSSQTILVVSHGGPLRILICLLLGLPPDMHWSFRVDHAGLTVIERCEGMGTVTLLNDTSHLHSSLESRVQKGL